MNHNLLVAVLGHRDAGKSTTWNTLFGRRVQTGQLLKPLWFGDEEYVEVYLVSGSPEERKKYVGKIIQGEPRIVLCSMQYRFDVTETIDYFADRDYFMYVHWLNPGHGDQDEYGDHLGIVPHLLQYDSVVGKRNGAQGSLLDRVEELRDYIYDWSARAGLIRQR